MSERRIDDLFTYLHALTRLTDDYKCCDEIGEVIAEIRRELIESKGEIPLPPNPQILPTPPITLALRSDNAKIYDLSTITTKQLTDELAKREGVSVVYRNLPTEHIWIIR